MTGSRHSGGNLARDWILQADAGRLRWNLRVAPDRADRGQLPRDHIPHWLHDLHAHLVASTPNARYVVFFFDDQVLNFRKLINRQLEVKDGDLLLPQTPGLVPGLMKRRLRNMR